MSKHFDTREKVTCFLVSDDVYLINWPHINDMALHAFNIN